MTKVHVSSCCKGIGTIGKNLDKQEATKNPVVLARIYMWAYVGSKLTRNQQHRWRTDLFAQTIFDRVVVALPDAVGMCSGAFQLESTEEFDSILAQQRSWMFGVQF